MRSATSTDSWIERVRAADAEAEAAYRLIGTMPESFDTNEVIAAAILAIAAELRAQRIARRPGAGLGKDKL